jgi:predicted metalloprotease
MKNKMVVGVMATAALALGSGGLATATPPPTGNNDPITGAGPAGSLVPVPACPVNTYVDVNTYQCMPLALQIPNGTTELSTTANCPVPQGMSFEEYFTDESEMPTLMECYLPSLEQWINDSWTGDTTVMHPNHYLYYTAAGGDGETGCVFQPGASPFYCPWDGNVYFDIGEVWTLLTTIGDLAPVIILSHEIGHRFQQVENFPHWDPEIPTEEIPTENQADCVSGVFTNWADRSGLLTPGNDAVDINQTLEYGGNSEEGTAQQERTHGDIDQRLLAFYTGYNGGHSQGLVACNMYVTDINLANPVVTQTAS